MPYKKKATPGTVQFNKLIAELPEKQEKVKSQVQFRHDLLESQNKLITRANSIAFKVLKDCQDWMPIQKNKNERSTAESETITERRTISSYLFY